MSERISKILILFYSRYGNTTKMAEQIAYGAKEVPNTSGTFEELQTMFHQR